MRLSTKVLKSGQFNFQPEWIVCETFMPPSSRQLPSLCDKGEDQSVHLNQAAPQLSQEEIEEQLIEWKELARQQGKQEGYLAGLQAGKQEARDELHGLISEAKNLLQMVMDKRENFMAAAEQELVELAVKIAGRVIEREVALDQGLILRTVRKALRYINQREGVTLRVCPLDVPQLTEANLVDLGITNFKLVEDPGLKPGDCIIDCQEGRVDAALSSQLAALAGELGVVAGV